MLADWKVTELVRRTVRLLQVVVPRRAELARDPSECGRAWTSAYEGPSRRNDSVEVEPDDSSSDF